MRRLDSTCTAPPVRGVLHLVRPRLPEQQADIRPRSRDVRAAHEPGDGGQHRVLQPAGERGNVDALLRHRGAAGTRRRYKERLVLGTGYWVLGRLGRLGDCVDCVECVD